MAQTTGSKGAPKAKRQPKSAATKKLKIQTKFNKINEGTKKTLQAMSELQLFEYTFKYIPNLTTIDAIKRLGNYPNFKDAATAAVAKYNGNELPAIIGMLGLIYNVFRKTPTDLETIFLQQVFTLPKILSEEHQKKLINFMSTGHFGNIASRSDKKKKLSREQALALIKAKKAIEQKNYDKTISALDAQIAREKKKISTSSAGKKPGTKGKKKKEDPIQKLEAKKLDAHANLVAKIKAMEGLIFTSINHENIVEIKALHNSSPTVECSNAAAMTSGYLKDESIKLPTEDDITTKLADPSIAPDVSAYLSRCGDRNLALNAFKELLITNNSNYFLGKAQQHSDYTEAYADDGSGKMYKLWGDPGNSFFDQAPLKGFNNTLCYLCGLPIDQTPSPGVRKKEHFVCEHIVPCMRGAPQYACMWFQGQNLTYYCMSFFEYGASHVECNDIKTCHRITEAGVQKYCTIGIQQHPIGIPHRMKEGWRESVVQHAAFFDNPFMRSRGGLAQVVANLKNEGWAYREIRKRIGYCLQIQYLKEQMLINALSPALQDTVSKFNPGQMYLLWLEILREMRGLPPGTNPFLGAQVGWHRGGAAGTAQEGPNNNTLNICYLLAKEKINIILKIEKIKSIFKTGHQKNMLETFCQHIFKLCKEDDDEAAEEEVAAEEPATEEEDEDKNYLILKILYVNNLIFYENRYLYIKSFFNEYIVTKKNLDNAISIYLNDAENFFNLQKTFLETAGEEGEEIVEKAFTAFTALEKEKEVLAGKLKAKEEEVEAEEVAEAAEAAATEKAAAAKKLKDDFLKKLTILKTFNEDKTTQLLLDEINSYLNFKIDGNIINLDELHVQCIIHIKILEYQEENLKILKKKMMK